MKLVVIALGLVAAALAAPPSDSVSANANAKTVRSQFDQTPEGGFNFVFETENGITREETGELKEVINEENKPQIVLVVRGSYTYKDEEGKSNTITYVADETGYHAEGDSIPKVQ